MTPRQQKWKAAMEKALARNGGQVLFRAAFDSTVKTSPFSKNSEIWWPAKGDAVNGCCTYANLYAVQRHLGTVWHFRNWCLRFPGRVRDRFPEAVELTAEEVLTNG